MVAKGTKRIGNYPVAQYIYTDAARKHPKLFIECMVCGQESLVKKGSRFCSTKCAQAGSNNSMWKGDDAGYLAAHTRIYKERGFAREYDCVDCEQTAAQWSYDEPTGYSTDMSRYSPRCVSCHRLFDLHAGGQ